MRLPLPCPVLEAIKSGQRGGTGNRLCSQGPLVLLVCSSRGGQLRHLSSGAAERGGGHVVAALPPIQPSLSCFPLPRPYPGSGVTGCLLSLALEWTL